MLSFPLFLVPDGQFFSTPREFFLTNQFTRYPPTNKNHPSSGEMQIVDINTAAKVWMVLPGKKASVFRSNLADLFIRVLGGDASLAEEIKQIGEFQDTLPESHPLRTVRIQSSTTTGGDPMGALLSFMTHQMETQKADRQQQMEFQKSQQEFQKSQQEFQTKLLEHISTIKAPKQIETAASSRASRPKPKNSVDTKDAMARFVRDFFDSQRSCTKFSVSNVMYSYAAYARTNNLPTIDTRMKFIRHINNVSSTRLSPQRSDGRINGWIWI